MNAADYLITLTRRLVNVFGQCHAMNINDAILFITHSDAITAASDIIGFFGHESHFLAS